VMLPDGNAFTVLEQAQKLTPAPIRIAMSGEASAEEAFRLAGFGVRRFLQKPVSLAEIWEAVCKANEEAPDLSPFVQESVGHVSLKALTGTVRSAAIRQALAIARGNRTRAARILQVTRQAVQQMVRQPKKRTPRA
jgi:two-component system response regulator RegA